MESLQSVDGMLDFAVGREQEAADFYKLRLRWYTITKPGLRIVTAQYRYVRKND